ncbi:unnamed protein product [Chondrus crispus]|uniref:Uncharacterized protein n=1 Tax=Chondrus crispus TaxID=2769 RepID=R7QFH4_CHOCR|nr:unnamed protein product [Chondrus crispus]CDF36839.1 unnamed protein product [Chondrus crispus]|eukprot:XP_005716658.1 unnamed protein product [Chondrus crispus]
MFITRPWLCSRYSSSQRLRKRPTHTACTDSRRTAGIRRYHQDLISYKRVAGSRATVTASGL